LFPNKNHPNDREKKEFVLSKQLLRSGTAVGALVRGTKYLNASAFGSIHGDVVEPLKLLTSIIKLIITYTF
jgi:hypothetical protein